jgi:hypothetical protein
VTPRRRGERPAAERERAEGIGLDAEAAREDIGRGSGLGGYWTRSGRRGILDAKRPGGILDAGAAGK